MLMIHNERIIRQLNLFAIFLADLIVPFR